MAEEHTLAWTSSRTAQQAPPAPPHVPIAPRAPTTTTAPGTQSPTSETGAEPHRVVKGDDGKLTVSNADGSTVVIDEHGITTTSKEGVVTQAGTVQAPSIPVIPTEAVDISLAFFLMIAFIAVGLPLARAFARRMDRKSEAPASNPDDRARLERIETALEAVALEVERIGEGQRYVTQLMGQREPAMAKLSGGER